MINRWSILIVHNALQWLPGGNPSLIITTITARGDGRAVIRNLRSDHALKRESSAEVVFTESHGFREEVEEEEVEEVEETVQREVWRPADRQPDWAGTAGEVNLSARELACQAG